MKYTFLIFSVLAGTGCNKNQYDMNEFYKMYGSDTNDAGSFIEEVSKHKVYFGHRSVGYNIIGGIEQWEEELGIALEKIDTRDFSNTGSASFIHFSIGLTSASNAKVDDFLTIVESIPERSEATAFFKFCYNDIEESTNVDSMFNYYKEKMHYLKDTYPECKIILCTVPLTGIQKGIKAVAKKVLSLQPAGVLENIKRNEFNEKLLSEFSGVFPIFDMAAVEATLPDGSVETYKHKGIEYPAVPPFYTSDLGHLNDYGARIVAYNLLAFLSEEIE